MGLLLLPEITLEEYLHQQLKTQISGRYNSNPKDRATLANAYKRNQKCIKEKLPNSKPPTAAKRQSVLLWGLYLEGG